MKNWRKAAAAFGLDLPEEDVARAGAVLDNLEAAFRPLASKLTFADDSAAQPGLNPPDWGAR